MKDIYEKFVYWDNLIKKEEETLLCVLTKIFNSVRLSIKLLEDEGTEITEKGKLEKLLADVDITKSFQYNLKVFYEIYRKLSETKHFELQVKNLETLERIRKTQYHIWNLFKFSHEYNILVRKYNARIDMPERFLVAKLHGFKKRLFVYDNLWYNNKSSVKIIGIAGPSGSGKGTISDLLKNNFDILYISFDNFFKKTTSEKYRGYTNWEHKNSLMFNKLYNCLKQLKRGEPTLIPTHGWTEEFDKLIYPKEIVLVEGFILFVNKKVNSILNKKIFLDLSEENQLLRRTKREGHGSIDYITKVVIPHFRKYRPILIKNSDFVIDANRHKHEVTEEIKGVLHKI